MRSFSFGWQVITQHWQNVPVKRWPRCRVAWKASLTLCMCLLLCYKSYMMSGLWCRAATTEQISRQSVGEEQDVSLIPSEHLLWASLACTSRMFHLSVNCICHSITMCVLDMPSSVNPHKLVGTILIQWKIIILKRLCFLKIIIIIIIKVVGGLCVQPGVLALCNLNDMAADVHQHILWLDKKNNLIQLACGMCCQSLILHIPLCQELHYCPKKQIRSTLVRYTLYWVTRSFTIKMHRGEHCRLFFDSMPHTLSSCYEYLLEHQIHCCRYNIKNMMSRIMN